MKKVCCCIYLFLLLQVYSNFFSIDYVYTRVRKGSIEFSAVKPMPHISSKIEDENKEHIKEYHENGVLKKYTPLRNGIIDGREKEFFDNGFLYK